MGAALRRPRPRSSTTTTGSRVPKARITEIAVEVEIAVEFAVEVEVAVEVAVMKSA
jgi:hypothetical protein